MTQKVILWTNTKDFNCVRHQKIFQNLIIQTFRKNSVTEFRGCFFRYK